MNKKRGTVALTALAALFSVTIQQADACTRATYIGPENLVITGRTMDWKEDIMSNIYVFPRGIQRAGYNKGETVKWTSKYGSVIATGYDIGTCDGMNEKGLVAGLLFLPESVYDRPGDTRPVMGISIWTQYVLDNFATVRAEPLLCSFMDFFPVSFWADGSWHLLRWQMFSPSFPEGSN